MTQQLTFAMGEFVAELPCDRMYAKNHMWAIPITPKVFRFGFSAYAVRLLQDIYFIDFDCVPGTVLNHRAEFGRIESKKAESGMYAPIDGEVIAINDQVLEDPSIINVDKYGAGWLLEIQSQNELVADELILTPSAYVQHLQNAWEIAQRTIKGQVNSD